MNDDSKKGRPAPWRIVLAVVSVLFIAWMWVKNDVVALYAAMPEEQLGPLIATTLLVTLLKVAALTGVFLLIRRLVGKRK